MEPITAWFSSHICNWIDADQHATNMYVKCPPKCEWTEILETLTIHVSVNFTAHAIIDWNLSFGSAVYSASQRGKWVIQWFTVPMGDLELWTPIIKSKQLNLSILKSARLIMSPSSCKWQKFLHLDQRWCPHTPHTPPHTREIQRWCMCFSLRSQTDTDRTRWQSADNNSK